jgi:hypothetical protein
VSGNWLPKRWFGTKREEESEGWLTEQNRDIIYIITEYAYTPLKSSNTMHHTLQKTTTCNPHNQNNKRKY